ncbi:hypothetical protein ECE50_012495 [Chitinophaga sp. Mgbs1]|uniref:Uncharacterized protein n=1 Tax=Chitinophaga solisilvae TaxID=1233460 RepID=A0A3S1B139_9BACT|nr:hypothetical protein [Chitinophaga solisilvae]
MNPQVDTFISNAVKWQQELEKLRGIILSTQLTEELKWGSPCYSFKKKNVLIIGELKDCCVLSFFKGILLQDPAGILTKPGDNTRSARTIRFTGVREIAQLENTILDYIREAIALEKAGKKVDWEDDTATLMPEELQQKMDKHPALKKAFHALTPGRQRAYLLHFSAPKQSATREARIEKYMQRIMDGKGLNDW